MKGEEGAVRDFSLKGSQSGRWKRRGIIAFAMFGGILVVMMGLSLLSGLGSRNAGVAAAKQPGILPVIAGRSVTGGLPEGWPRGVVGGRGFLLSLPAVLRGTDDGPSNRAACERYGLGTPEASATCERLAYKGDAGSGFGARRGEYAVAFFTPVSSEMLSVGADTVSARLVTIALMGRRLNGVVTNPKSVVEAHSITARWEGGRWRWLSWSVEEGVMPSSGGGGNRDLVNEAFDLVPAGRGGQE